MARRAHTFSLAGIGEGVQTVTTTGQDVLSRTASASRTLRIDRSRPAPPSGENDGLIWPHCDGLNWPHLRPIVV